MGCETGRQNGDQSGPKRVNVPRRCRADGRQTDRRSARQWFALLLCALVSVIAFMSACREKAPFPGIVHEGILVYDRETEKPVPGARVRLYANTLDGSPFAEGVTDARGIVVFCASKEQAESVEQWFYVAWRDGYSTGVAWGTGLFSGLRFTFPLSPVKATNGSGRAQAKE